MRLSASQTRLIAVGAIMAVSFMAPISAATAAGANDGLKVQTGNLYVEKAGAVIEGLEIRGRLIIKANDVTVRNVLVVGDPNAITIDTLVDVGRGTKGVKIEDTTIRPVVTGEFAQGVRGWGFTLDRVDISNVVDGVMVTGSNVTVRNSVIHDLYVGPSTTQKDGVTHTDSIQIEGGNSVVVEGNTLSGANTAAIMVTQNASKVSGLSINNNQLRDGSCTINMDEKGKGSFTGITIASNKFGATSNASTCSMRLPSTSKSTITATGNTLLTGATTTPWWY